MNDGLRAALLELLDEYHLGDMIYDVRSRFVEDGSHKGSAWEHPKVVRFGEIVVLLRKEVEAILANRCRGCGAYDGIKCSKGCPSDRTKLPDGRWLNEPWCPSCGVQPEMRASSDCNDQTYHSAPAD